MRRNAAIALALTLLVAGCGEEQQELRDWMRDQRRSVTPRAEQVLPPKQFEPFRYDSAGQGDPFSPARLASRTAESGRSRLQPDLARRREALEGFPLDVIRMVGHLNNASGEFALLQAENLVYRVQVGNYAGQNFGRIVGISENEVRLRELVQDGAGDWVERDTVLQLQLRQESKK